MAVKDIDVARRAFASPEWCSGADAIYSAAGVSVSVVDFVSGEVLSGGRVCSYCPHVTDRQLVAGGDCFDTYPHAEDEQGRMICRAGLPALYSTVTRGDRSVAHVVLSGFVTSTRERRGRYEHLRNTGMSEEAARRRIKSLPILSRAQAEAFLQMAVASATTIFAATFERMAAAERVEELRLFVTSGHTVAATARLDETALLSMAEQVCELAGAQAAALLRPHGAELEVVAISDAWRGSVGAVVVRATTVAGKAFESGSATLSGAREDGTITAAVPLMSNGRAVGVFELRLDAAASSSPADRLAKVARFAQFAAIALERDAEHEAVERAMGGYTCLNALASELGGLTEPTAVAQTLLAQVQRAFGYDVAGVVLSGWGVDRADLAFGGVVGRDELDELLQDVTGRDSASDPYAEMHVAAGELLLVQGAAEIGEGGGGPWALSSVAIGHGQLDVGWLFVARRDGATYSAQDRALLEGFAAHGGPAFGRAALFARIRDDYASTIETLSATVSAGVRSDVSTPRDSTQAGNVMEYAVALGEKLELGVSAVERLRVAGLMHDIGQAGLPGTVTLTPPTLTPSELLTAASRTEPAPTIIEQIAFLETLTPVVLHHHENWDGSGYPHGLAADEIPLLSRVLRVADAFDELTASRDPERRCTPLQAVEQINGSAGTLYDPQVAQALSQVVNDQIAAGLSAHGVELSGDQPHQTLPS